MKDIAFARAKRQMDEAQIRYEGKEEGIKRGVMEGKREEKSNIAAKLKQMGFSNNQIIQITELDLDEIETVK